MKKIILGLVLLLTTVACKFEEKPKTEAEILKEQKDSINKVREQKIDYALSQLKDMIKKDLKDHSSYEMVERTWDKKDTLDVVKLLIGYRASNSFGAKVQSTCLANYNLKDETIIITKHYVNE
ncbi:hypothetical protein FIA58_013905 [Flavobacterium jejuense]|uniref:Lipoprotein n=1 Tax=Flavobacterium jejuense TaxID=1544455 RepID=A0ABX0IYI9_9FLAO|nr:hypothetical protein [Flavobacterium jejuense]NHN26775.1 hypothetical protein [Flavobacterium jejuense]